ncbi:MAG: hypothetical protein AABX00_01315 [Nanoarchaeota archaeon]
MAFFGFVVYKFIVDYCSVENLALLGCHRSHYPPLLIAKIPNGTSFLLDGIIYDARILMAASFSTELMKSKALNISESEKLLPDETSKSFKT